MRSQLKAYRPALGSFILPSVKPSCSSVAGILVIAWKNPFIENPFPQKLLGLWLI